MSGHSIGYGEELLTFCQESIIYACLSVALFQRPVLSRTFLGLIGIQIWLQALTGTVNARSHIFECQTRECLVNSRPGFESSI